ncbi:hypothetical protein BC941DRAFT_509341 [Chlamydoabsidia padenii]|nr:hypothetical protein BC941DRAFT_509341 [Chlamydoabsidia padenii]
MDDTGKTHTTTRRMTSSLPVAASSRSTEAPPPTGSSDRSSLSLDNTGQTESQSAFQFLNDGRKRRRCKGARS